MAEIEETEREEGLEDRVEDFGEVVMGEIDSVKFVEFWEGFFGDVCNVVVGDVEDF